MSPEDWSWLNAHCEYLMEVPVCHLSNIEQQNMLCITCKVTLWWVDLFEGENKNDCVSVAKTL